MNPDSDARLLGEYRLKELLDENATTRTWLAEQVSVSRAVLVEELREDAEDQRGAFLADIRAKAAIDHPLISSVYEAVSEPGRCFYAHELLHGNSLAALMAARGRFLPAKLANVLRKVSEAQLQHEALDHATSPMGPEDIFFDEHGVVRLKNLAIAGPRTADQSERDLLHLGTALVPLVAIGQPGASRMLTVLGWMRGQGVEVPLSWSQVRDLCMQIDHQLADPLSSLTPTTSVSLAQKKPIFTTAIFTLLILAAIIVLAIALRPPAPQPQRQRRTSLPEPVSIPAGMHPTPDGLEEELPAFRISTNETTIGQYAEFLDTLGVHSKNGNEHIFDAPDQPADKTSHAPDDWVAMLAAAKSRKIWQNLSVDLDTPVVGVDWWDAFAFAGWKKGRLPTQEEWFAAVTTQVKIPGAIVPAPWESVTLTTTDVTPVGLIGMAGSVSEWALKPAANPANPLGEKLWVIIGGSYLQPASNALSREWTGDRSVRRKDLGFRVVFDAK
jgi:hypothetical protein